jgi:hypothetical protein
MDELQELNQLNNDFDEALKQNIKLFFVSTFATIFLNFSCYFFNSYSLFNFNIIFFSSYYLITEAGYILWNLSLLKQSRIKEFNLFSSRIKEIIGL